jgi:hypothetical protein
MNSHIPTDTVQAIALEMKSSETFRQAQLYLEKITAELEALRATMQEEDNAQDALFYSGDEQAHAYILRKRTDSEEDEGTERATLFINLDNILSILKTGTPSVYPKQPSQDQMYMRIHPHGPCLVPVPVGDL